MIPPICGSKIGHFFVPHKPVFFEDVGCAGCSRCRRYLSAATYDLKFPSVFWNNQNARHDAYVGDGCKKCDGYGWDADWGGPYTCMACWGTGRELKRERLVRP